MLLGKLVRDYDQSDKNKYLNDKSFLFLILNYEYLNAGHLEYLLPHYEHLSLNGNHILTINFDDYD